MGIDGIPIQKTRIGEHDFRRPACAEFCRMDARFCPFVQNDRKTVSGIVRWTDLAEDLHRKRLGIGDAAAGTGSYTAKFEGKGSWIKLPGENPVEDGEDEGEDARSLEQKSYEIMQGGYTCWGDGSGLEYDQMTRNLVGIEQWTESAYDIKDFETMHAPLRFSSWNAWIDKAQYDQRFGRVSDLNAETVLFPNVDNPWMFTEYVFRGVGGDAGSGKIKWQVPGEYVVEPPVYSIRDGKLCLENGDLEGINLETYAEGKYGDYMVVGGTTEYSDGSGGGVGANSAKVRQFRQVSGWDRVIDWKLEDFGNNAELYSAAVKAGLVGGTGSQPGVRDAGVCLYRARIPVQCVKWGEHGNIPPHTLDMTAPSDYFETGKNILTMRAVYSAEAGAPFYTDTHGVIVWGRVGGQAQNMAGMTASVYECEYEKEQKASNGAKRLKASLGDKIKDLDMPQRIDAPGTRYLTPSKILVGSQSETGNCWAGTGCANLRAYQEDGGGLSVRCQVIEQMAANGDPRLETMNEHFSWKKCHLDPANGGEHNTECEFNVPVRDYPAIALYQLPIPVDTFTPSQSYFGNAWQSVLSALKSVYDPVAEFFKNIMNLSSDGVSPSYSVRYEPIYLNTDAARLTDPPSSKKYNEFFEGAQVVKDSGKYALEKRNEGLIGGDDTFAYNDISTRSFHRFFQSVMHCATQRHCNVFTGSESRSSWRPGYRSKGDDDCPYYHELVAGRPGCPYNCAPKRAVEFSSTAAALVPILSRLASRYEELTQAGCWDLDGGSAWTRSGEDHANGSLCDFGDFGACLVSDGGNADGSNDVLVGISVRIEQSDLENGAPPECIYDSAKYGGASLRGTISVKQSQGGEDGETELLPCEGQMFLCVFRARLEVKEPEDAETETGDDEGEAEKPKPIHTHKVLSWYYWYRPLTDSGKGLLPDTEGAVLPEMRQHVDGHGLWLCRFFWSSTTIPSSNCMQVDNDEKFLGGWHPEYKDYGKRGPEFLQEVFEDEDERWLGSGDNVHSGDYNPVPLNSTTEGYWVDQSGEYILDEREIGYGERIAGNDARENTGGAGTAVCISFLKSNTTVNPETGEQIAPKTINGAVYSNDPFVLVQEQYRQPDPDNPTKPNGKKNGVRPTFRDPSTDEEYWAPCHAGGGYFLPTMRHAWWCPECDYFLAYRYGGKYKDAEGKERDICCPWCGNALVEIHGSDGSEYWSVRHSAEGKSWSDAAVAQEPSRKNPPKVITKFFKLYGIGNADVWAPPGTSVRTDAYFWRRQAQVSNALRRQFYHRFGSSNKASKGGGYKFDEMTPGTEMTLGYPEMVGKFSSIPAGVRKLVEKPSVGAGGETVTTLESEFVPTAQNYDPELRYSRMYIAWRPTDHAESDGMWNSVSPRHFIPGLYGNKADGKEDEGVIAPYTTSAEDALKTASYRQLWAMRNAVEPMFAYVQDPDGGSEYPVRRASYDDRLSINQNIVWSGHRSVISPTVLASTDDGVDSYQVYFSGDARYGNVREYFPSGYTWWFMHQQLGGRYTTHQEGKYHMDDQPGGRGARMEGGSGGEYTTGDRTVAKCAISIYGMLPLDKEIVKAYVVIRPSGVDPSKDPVGFAWNGIANRAMYMHYHAKRETHANGGREPHAHGNFGLGYDKNGDLIELDEDGHYEEYDRATGHTYTKDMWGRIVAIDGVPLDDGDDEEVNGTGAVARPEARFLDEGAARLWAEQSEHIEDDRNMYYEDRFGETMVNACGMHDMAFYREVGARKTQVMSYGGEEVAGMGYSSRELSRAGLVAYNFSFTTAKANQRLQYVVVGEDGDLVEPYPDSVAWKRSTSEEINAAIDDDTAVIGVTISDGTEEDMVHETFTQYGNGVHGSTVPGESQRVSGYFDMSWTNSRSISHGEYRASAGTQTSWDAPVIFQDASSVSVKVSDYSGGAADDGQTGIVERVVDCTNLVRRLYNTRIDRDFTCQAGARKDDVLKWAFYRPERLGTLDELDADVSRQNVQVWHSKSRKYGYLLTDTDSYPDIGGDINTIPTATDVGNKYGLAPKRSRIQVRLAEAPVALSGNAEAAIGFYRFGAEGESAAAVKELEVALSAGKSFESAKDAASALFGKGSEATVSEVSRLSAVVESDYEIRVEMSYDNSADAAIFGEELGEGAHSFLPVQDRVVSVSSYSDGFHPLRLLGAPEEEDDEDGPPKWYFSTYLDETQSFVVDLLRAPLCSVQRDYLDTPGRMDYSGAKCPTLSCEAHTRGVAVAANLRKKTFDRNSSKCPLCHASLSGAAGAQFVPGDGIMTYEYDGAFDPDPFIKAIEVAPYGEVSYRVLCRNSGSDEWMPLVDYSYDSNGDGAAANKSWRQNFPVLEADGGRLEKPSTLFSDDAKDGFGTVRARFLRVEVDPTMRYEFHQLKVVQAGKLQQEGATALDSSYQVVVEGDFSGIAGLSLTFLDAAIGDRMDVEPSFEAWRDYWNAEGDVKNKVLYGDPVKIISGSIVNEGMTLLRVSLGREYPQTKEGENDTFHYDDRFGVGSFLKFYAPKYCGGIRRFAAWGMHYKTNPGMNMLGSNLDDIDDENKDSRKASKDMYLTITGQPDFYSEPFAPGKTRFRLPSRPTQIFRMSVGKGAGGSVVLTQAKTPYGIRWKTQDAKATFTGNAKTGTGIFVRECSIKKVVGGEYYYNPANGTIVLPADDGTTRFQDFEKEVDDLRKDAVEDADVKWTVPGGKLYLPDHITVTYWSGNGRSIALPAVAKGTGPSYMVEKNAICRIVSGSLPDNGRTCDLLDTDGNVRSMQKIEWFCYNNEPAGLDIGEASVAMNNPNMRYSFNSGEFVKPAFTGKELAKEFGNDQAFVDLFGDHAENCDRTCTTMVTFTGAPNQVLSGKYVVRAPAETTGSQGYRERTGGISNGFIVVSAAPESAPSGKMTICYGIPKLIIYAKERYPWSG